MIAYSPDDLFSTRCASIVNTVNCVGAMGRGVAEGVRDRWPSAYHAYRRDCGIGLACDGRPDRSIGPQRDQGAPPCLGNGRCDVHRVRPGSVLRYDLGSGGVRHLFNLPTKRHWNAPSLRSDVAAGLVALRDAIALSRVESVAMTPPGCGHGGLRWADIRPLVIEALGPLEASVVVHCQAP